MASTNPLRALQDYGQSVWYDNLRRGMVTSGELDELVERDGLRGVTSNPAIFEKAIAGSPDYEQALRAIEKDAEAGELYEQLAVEDIQMAADRLRPIYDRTNRRDGYISLEVSPYLALDTEATVEEARRLWRSVGRDNLMVKVPATEAGIPAIRQLIGEGINVNVTLLFAQAIYERVAQAYIDGLEAYARNGGGNDVGRIASVASFFISRIDTVIDKLIQERLATASGNERAVLEGLLGQVAIANAKLTYRRYKEIYADGRWRKLADAGAQTQRLLWASTGTKNPDYRDVIYVEELIGPDTVNTMPPATMDAFRDHGKPRASLEEDVERAAEVMATLERVGISMDAVTRELVEDGVQLFADAADRLLGAVARRREEVLGDALNRQAVSVQGKLADDVKAALEDWRAGGKIRRLWARDASLWTGADEAEWLGWLGAVKEGQDRLGELNALAEEVKAEGFSDVLLLGMGGSSLGPEVLANTFGRQDGFPRLHVLDSTDPAEVNAAADRVDLARTLFIVSSKSGSTLEPNILKQYFFERAKEATGGADVGRRFVAVTDPGSSLERVAAQDGFRHTYPGKASIGGRYSILSNFGLVPAAAMGLDLARFLQTAAVMTRACGPSVPPTENPGVMLGMVMGVAAKHGRDKLTVISSPGIADFGAWLEQLVAESTGKLGKGIIPVDGEPVGAPEVYGDDRLFAYLRLDSGADDAQDRAVAALLDAGHPVVRISVREPFHLGQGFFRWEIATAVAGSILGINPFDQPDVEASKVATRRLTDEYERTGRLSSGEPFVVDDSIELYADERNAGALKGPGGGGSLGACLKVHLGRVGAGDYVALLAYIHRNDANTAALQATRTLIRDRKRAATCLGFGPRFLHSTGQAYKGGPNSGVFLQITCNDPADLPVPGQRYSFGVVKAAQAQGDFQVLCERERRALRVHLTGDVRTGLDRLHSAVREALA